MLNYRLFEIFGEVVDEKCVKLLRLEIEEIWGIVWWSEKVVYFCVLYYESIKKYI